MILHRQLLLRDQEGLEQWVFQVVQGDQANYQEVRDPQLLRKRALPTATPILTIDRHRNHRLLD